jgi:hypothetical protein
MQGRTRLWDVVNTHNINIISMAYKRRYLFECVQHVSGITFIRYAQNQKIGKQNKLKRISGASNPKDLSMRACAGGRFSLVLINYIC